MFYSSGGEQYLQVVFVGFTASQKKVKNNYDAEACVSVVLLHPVLQYYK